MTTIQICGIIGWDCTPQDLREALNAANGADVEIEISSPGGYIAPGLEMFNLIRNYPGRTQARLTGYAMSMASYIPLACDAIVAEDNAVYMIHNARGGAWGDHNDVLGYGNYLKGLSGLICKAYAKRTGKTLEDLAAMMDAETYFFGSEMVEAGFVDSIIETETDEDKDNALACARASFEDAFARITSEAAQAREDMQRAAALMKEFNIVEPQNSVPAETPAAAGKTKEEVQQMPNLTQMLADNPAAKAEYEANLATARAEGENAGSEAVTARIDKVAPFLASKEYPAKVSEIALSVLKGDEPVGTLSAAVAAVDAVREEKNQGAAASEQGKETPPEQAPAREPGAVVASQEDLDEEINRLKGQGGN